MLIDLLLALAVVYLAWRLYRLEQRVHNDGQWIQRPLTGGRRRG